MDVTVLVIGYNRPNYLSKVIDSLKIIEPIQVLFSFDHPIDEEDQYKVENSITLAENFTHPQKKINVENSKLGCKGHVMKALKWALEETKNDFILILEDDIVLKENSFDGLKEFMETYNEPQVLKLNQYFWGWMVHKDVLKELLKGIKEFVTEYIECDYNVLKLNDFKNKYHGIFKDTNNVVIIMEPLKSGIYLPWDEEFYLVIKFKGILEVKSNIFYSENIGNESSRDMGKESDYYGSASLRFYVENGKAIYF